MKRRMKTMKITLDPGHGRYGNPGAIAGYYEGTRMFVYAGMLKRELEKYEGVEVYLTRNELTDDPTLAERGRLAGDTASELFISLHSNGFSSEKAHGVTVFRSVKRQGSLELATLLANTVVDTMKPSTKITYLRGVATRTYTSGGKVLDYYGVIRNAVKSDKVKYAFIIEHGFHSNPTECEFLYSDEKLKLLSESTALCIASYFGLEKRKEGLIYTVKKNDTLSGIARLYGTTWRILAEYNGLEDPDLITVGQIIRIPEAKERELRVGDTVRLKDGLITYFPGGNPFPPWVPKHVYTIEKISDSKGNEVYRGGDRAVLLGKHTDPATGKRYGSIKSWASVEYLELISK